MHLQLEADHYVRTALWSSNDNADDSGGEPLDANYDADDIDAETLSEMRRELSAFIRSNAADCERWAELLGDGQVGHDFWLTRNEHGAGFWDFFRDDSEEGKISQRLTDAAKAAGTYDLYVADDGKIYKG